MVAEIFNNILVIAPSWIGDMVMAQSLLQRLKQENSEAKITVFAPSWCLPLLERMPQIDEAVANPFGHGQLRLRDRMQVARQLKAKHFDLVLVLPHSLKSALIPLLAGIKVRRGWLGEQRYFFLNQRYSDKKPMPLLVQQYNALAYDPDYFDLSKVAKNPYPKLLSYKDQAQSILAGFGIDEFQKVLGLCPGAEYGIAKRWPTRYFAKVAQLWIEQGGVVQIFGGPKDDPAALEIKKQIALEQQKHCYLLTGKTTLPQVVDLLANCEAVITNDSGLMHVSAAVGTKLVAVYGSSTTSYTPPLTDQAKTVYLNDLACRPCFKRVCPHETMECLNNIHPRMILQELNNLLGVSLPLE